MLAMLDPMLRSIAHRLRHADHFLEKEDFDDLLQEARVEALLAIRRFNEALGATIHTWVWRVVYGKLANRYRQASRASSYELTERNHQMSHDYTAQAFVRLIHRGLDDTEKAIIVGRTMGLTYEEIGTIMGVSKQAVHSKWKKLQEKVSAE